MCTTRINLLRPLCFKILDPPQFYMIMFIFTPLVYQFFILCRRKLSVDRRSEPRVSERVPYVVVHGSPGLPLIQLVRTPQEYLRDPSLQLNAPYYITRQIIPALNRVLGIMGVDTLEWYQALPRGMYVNTVPSRIKATANTKKVSCPSRYGTISQHFLKVV